MEERCVYNGRSVTGITAPFCPSENKAHGNFLIGLDKLDDSKNEIGVYNLVSDSIYITKVSDSTYYFCPMYENTLCKIFIVDNRQFNVVDSISLEIGRSAFSFNITLLNFVHGSYSFSEIISKADRVFLFATDMMCFKIKEKPKIISYTLCLKRGNDIKAAISLKGEQLIPKSFKQKIIEIYEHGDELCAKNIYFRNEIGIIFQKPYAPLYRNDRVKQ